MNIIYYLVSRGHPLSYAMNLNDYEKWMIGGMIDAKNAIEEV